MTVWSATVFLQCFGFQPSASGCPAHRFDFCNNRGRHLFYECMLQVIVSVQLCWSAHVEQGCRAVCIHEAWTCFCHLMQENLAPAKTTVVFSMEQRLATAVSLTRPPSNPFARFLTPPFTTWLFM